MRVHRPTNSFSFLLQGGLLALVSVAAVAANPTVVYHDGKAYTLKYSYAYQAADPNQDGKPVTTVVFADKPIDAAAMKIEFDRGEALDAALQGANRITLKISPDGEMQGLADSVSGGDGLMMSGSGWFHLDLAHNDAKRIEGRFLTDKAEKKQEGQFYDLNFALDLPGPPGKGKPIAPGGAGQFFHDGKLITLTSGYAYRGPDHFHPDQQMLVLDFSDQPTATAAINDAPDRASALEEQRTQGNRVTLNIGADGSLINANFRADGLAGSGSGSGWYKLQLRQNDDKRVEGRFVSTDEASKTHGEFYDLKFSFDLPGAPDLGPAVAAGGETDLAYRAHLEALKGGNVDALAKTMTAGNAAKFLSARNEAYFPRILASIQGSALVSPSYVKGNARGDWATLSYTGKDGKGRTATHVVTLHREAGAWKVGRDSSG